MDIKPIKYYLIVLLIFVGIYTYCGLNGIAFYEDKVEKNTEFNGNRTHVGTANRFYHK
ncbi:MULTISPECIES: hypothetical protein [unclassified Pedobacter]|uniref:hypothetical protein n=1 Tax=unclassified Pedobacter TaxID=2628915 RepID=UPI001E5D73A2|nr:MULTISPECIES: hypothetical protein [unclassified Pedobacter]